MNKEYLVFMACVQGDNSVFDLKEMFDFNVSDLLIRLIKQKHVILNNSNLDEIVLPTEKGMDYWNEYCNSCECIPCDCTWGNE